MAEPTYRLTPKEKALLLFSMRMQLGVFVLTAAAIAAAFTAALEGADVAFAIGLGAVALGAGFLILTPSPILEQRRFEREEEEEEAAANG